MRGSLSFAAGSHGMIAMCRGAGPGSIRVPDPFPISRRIAAIRWSAKLNPIHTRCPPSTSRRSTCGSFPPYARRYSVVASTMLSGWLCWPCAYSTGSSISPKTSPVRQPSSPSSSRQVRKPVADAAGRTRIRASTMPGS